MAEKRTYNTRSRKRSQEAKEVTEVEPEDSKVPECPICLQTCSHPARLPCSHIFCFLCLKGVFLSNRKCPMCRAQIPHNYLDNPDLLQVPKSSPGPNEAYKWYYEGRHGWWEYDSRTSKEIERAFQANERETDIFVSGFAFKVDFVRMVQTKSRGGGRMRRVKRDRTGAPSKGVAGIRKHRKLPATPNRASQPAGLYGYPTGPGPQRPRLNGGRQLFREMLEEDDNYDLAEERLREMLEEDDYDSADERLREMIEEVDSEDDRLREMIEEVDNDSADERLREMIEEVDSEDERLREMIEEVDNDSADERLREMLDDLDLEDHEFDYCLF